MGGEQSRVRGWSVRKRKSQVTRIAASSQANVPVDSVSIVVDSITKPPAPRLRLGELRAAVLRLEHDFAQDDLRRTQAFEVIAGFISGRDSPSYDTGILDDMITALSLVLERFSDKHRSAAALHNHFGCVLLGRFGELSTESKARRDVLNDAILPFSRSVELTSTEDSSLIPRLRNLADALDDRFVRNSDSKDLDGAIAAYRRCIELAAGEDHIVAELLSILGDYLHGRFDYLSQEQDLEEAITSYRRSIDLTPDENVKKPDRFMRLANILRHRFERSGEAQKLEEALLLLRRAVTCLPQERSDMHNFFASLAGVLEARFHVYGDESDKTESCLLLMQACQQPGVPPLIKFGYALVGVENLETYPFLEGCFSLLRAYKCMAEAYPQAQIAWLGKNIIEKLRDLSLLPFPASGAASAAIASGQLALAVEWLEEGRSVVWGQILQLRHGADQLREHHPDFAARLASVSSQLESMSMEYSGTISFFEESTEHPGLPRVRKEQENQGQSKLALEYQALLHQIRSLNGFERFLAPRPCADLVAAAIDGPIVLINLYNKRSDCDAIILFPGADVSHVALPNFSYKAAERLRKALKTSLNDGGLRQRGDRPVNMEYCGSIQQILAMLWKGVAEPVVNVLQSRLRRLSTEGLIHVTWCLTGPLSFLPLHAAGIYDEGEIQVTLMDFVVSSYTPSVEALLHSKSSSVPPDRKKRRVLTIAQPYALPNAPIPNTLRELRLVRNHFPDGVALENDMGTVDAILDEMLRHEWVHFACHGIQHLEDPTQSSFALHDGKSLRLSQLMSLSNRMARTEPAFLSACQTATGNETVPDEAIHLAASMLAAGFSSVVGTMWSISDDDAPSVADAFYSALRWNTRDGGDVRAAYALHAAVRGLRQKVGEKEFLRWVPFVHFGR